MKSFLIRLLLSAALLWTCCARETLPTSPPAPAPLTRIDLSRYVNPGDSAGFVYSDQMAVKDGKAYLLIQRLNGWNADSAGLVAVINVASDSLERTIRLRHGNPGAIAISGNTLLVAASGSIFVAGDGALEKAGIHDSLSTDLITESALDPLCAGFYQIEVKNDSTVFVSASLGWENTPVCVVNTVSGRVVQRLAGVVDAYGGIAFSKADDRLYVGERDSAAAGIRVYDGTTLTQIGALIPTVLPPYSLSMHVSGSSRFLLVAMSDYSSGRVQVMDCAGAALSAWNLAVYQDAVVRSAGGRFFVLERGAISNLLELDVSGHVIRQIHLGDGVNPVDIKEAVAGKFYLSEQNTTYLGIWK